MRTLRQGLRVFAALALWLLSASAALAANCNAYPFTFSNGTTSDATQVNANFASILTCANTNLAPTNVPTFTGPVTINGTPLGIPSGGTGATTLAGAGIALVGSANTFTAGPQALSGTALNEAFATIASAATTNIGAAAANYLQVTGTTGITAFDTVQAGTERTLEFAGALTISNGANIILLGGGNYTTAAGDVLKFRSEGAGVWRQVTLGRASGLPVINKQVFTSGGTFTTPANTNANTVYKFTLAGGGGGGGGANGGGGNQAGGGGAPGATAIYYGTGVPAGTGVPVTVGSGGSAGSGAPGAGGTGGDSSIVFNATTVTAHGGTGGGAGVNGLSVNGGTGGTASNGTVNISGGGGGAGLTAAGGVAGGTGGASSFGGGGQGAAASGAGVAGAAFGSGGGGAGVASGFGASSGGAGAPGIVIVEWVQ